MSWSVLAGAGGTTACALFAALVVFVVVVGVFLRSRRAAPAEPRSLPPDLTTDRRPLRDIAPGNERREALLQRLEPALGYLGDELQVVKGSKGDLRFRGALRGHSTALDIDSGGLITQAHVTATFPPGTLVLHARHPPEDPGSLLLLLDALEVEDLSEQMKEARLASIRFTADGVTATSEARLHDVDYMEETNIVGQTLAALENGVGLWQDRDVMGPPEAPPPSLPPPPPPAASTGDPLASAFSWDPYGDDVYGALGRAAEALFEAVGDTLAGGKLVLPDKDEGGDAELRGRVNDVPIRLILTTDGEWKLEAKIASVDDGLYVQFDPELAPKAGDPNDDWADQDDIRVFVAKGLYVEATPDIVEDYMRFCERLDPSQIELLRDGMELLPIQFVWFLSDELEVGGKGTVQELDDPLTLFQGILDFVGWLGSDIPGSAADAGAFAQLSCTYCSSRFFHGVRQPSCPNCGATPEA